MASLRNYALALAFALTTVAPQLSSAQSPTTLSVAPTATAAGKQCYLPNGAEAGDVPCDPNADHSMCCPSRERCLSNGLCLTVPNLNETGLDIGHSYARGTCTDPFWKDKRCPQNCIDNPDEGTVATALNWRADGVMVYGCEREGYGAPAAYCCESIKVIKECCNPTGTFSLQAATVGPALALQTYPGPNDNPSTISRPLTSSSRTASGTSNPTGSPVTTPGPSSLPSDGTSSPGGLSDGAKVGLGVGLGIGGLLFILGLAFLYYYRRSHPSAKDKENTADPNNPSNPSNPNDARSPSITSVNSGTTAAGQGGNGVWVDGRFYPAADGNSAELGAVIYAKELDSRRSLKELDGQIMAREVHTWEHTPAELPVDQHNSGWGQWEERERVGAQEGDAIKGGGPVPVVQVGEVSPLSPSAAKPANATTTFVPVGDEQTLPSSQEGEKWDTSESRWEGVAKGRAAQGNGTG